MNFIITILRYLLVPGLWNGNAGCSGIIFVGGGVAFTGAGSSFFFFRTIRF